VALFVVLSRQGEENMMKSFDDVARCVCSCYGIEIRKWCRQLGGFLIDLIPERYAMGRKVLIDGHFGEAIFRSEYKPHEEPWNWIFPRHDMNKEQIWTELEEIALLLKPWIILELHKDRGEHGAWTVRAHQYGDKMTGFDLMEMGRTSLKTNSNGAIVPDDLKVFAEQLAGKRVMTAPNREEFEVANLVPDQQFGFALVVINDKSGYQVAINDVLFLFLR
jgi:hypothetical protein